jgi:hypothetical protein
MNHPDTHQLLSQLLSETAPDVVEVILTQLSLNAGLKTWKDKDHKAIHVEMKQLHLRDTFRPKLWKELTEEQRAAILESHLFLKQKSTGVIKGRAVAGRNSNETSNLRSQLANNV